MPIESAAYRSSIPKAVEELIMTLPKERRVIEFNRLICHGFIIYKAYKTYDPLTNNGEKLTEHGNRMLRHTIQVFKFACQVQNDHPEGYERISKIKQLNSTSQNALALLEPWMKDIPAAGRIHMMLWLGLFHSAVTVFMYGNNPEVTRKFQDVYKRIEHMADLHCNNSTDANMSILEAEESALEYVRRLEKVPEAIWDEMRKLAIKKHGEEKVVGGDLTEYLSGEEIQSAYEKIQKKTGMLQTGAAVRKKKVTKSFKFVYKIMAQNPKKKGELNDDY